jgi:Na+/glutamate symporter
MGFWKVMGGVAAGVGTVVCLPVAGAVGAVTLAGAAVGGVAGGVAGAVASKKEKQERASAREAGERTATAKYEKKIEKLCVALDTAEKQLKDDKAYFQLLIAMFAVGMATANADGVVCASELDDLDEFVTGIAHSNLPPHVKGMITRLKNNPPNFKTAMAHVNKLENIDLGLFRTVIELVSASDGVVSAEETALLAAFDAVVA